MTKFPSSAAAMAARIPSAVSVETKHDSTALTDLDELHKKVQSHNKVILDQVEELIELGNGLHGETPQDPDASEPQDETGGVLGHVRFALVEQERLLNLLMKAVSRL